MKTMRMKLVDLAVIKLGIFTGFFMTELTKNVFYFIEINGGFSPTLSLKLIFISNWHLHETTITTTIRIAFSGHRTTS